MPVQTTASQSILSQRPLSAYTKLPQQRQKQLVSLGGLADQIQDLQEKELNLEKARTNLFVAAEEQRSKARIMDLEKQHDAHIELLKTQHQGMLSAAKVDFSHELGKVEREYQAQILQLTKSHEADQSQFLVQIMKVKENAEIERQRLIERQAEQLQARAEEYHLKCEKMKVEHSQEIECVQKTLKA